MQINNFVSIANESLAYDTILTIILLL